MAAVTAKPLPSGAGAERLLDVQQVCVSFAGRPALADAGLQVHRGEIVTLIGLNGSGKSTLVRVALGLLRPDTGRVWRAPGLRVGYTPQHMHADPAMPLTVRRFLQLGARADDRRLRALLHEVDAGDVLEAQLADISGGELHRVMLARALLREPDLLVLDEPLAGVDVNGQSELYRLIATLRDRYRCGVLLVSHDLHLVMAATDSVVCINHHVCCTGKPESVAQHPEFVALFGRHFADVVAVYHHEHDHEHDLHGDVVPLPQPDDAPDQAAR